MGKMKYIDVNLHEVEMRLQEGDVDGALEVLDMSCDECVLNALAIDPDLHEHLPVAVKMRPAIASVYPYP